MLHILLLILKIIGIILAVILGILVLLVCIVIFVPVRYEINGKCSGTLSTLKVKGKATWLCSLVRADIYYKENKLKWRLRIAWKKFLGGQEYGTDTPSDESLPWDMSTQNKKMEGEEDEKRDEEIWKRYDYSEEGSKEFWYEAEEGSKAYEEIWEDEAGEGEEDEKSHEKAWYQFFKTKKGQKAFSKKFGKNKEEYEEIYKNGEEEYPGYEEGDFHEREAYEEWNEEGSRGIKGFIQKIKGIYSWIKYTIRNICDKIKELLEIKDKLAGFIRDESHVGAFRKVKKEAFRLFRRLRPKKLLVEVRFGFDDPSLTGRTLAVIAPFYPFFGGFVSLQPDFTEKILKGRLQAKGNIRFCHFAVMVWNLLWSKNVRRTYKDIMNFEI